LKALITLCTYSASAENSLGEQGQAKMENQLLVRDILLKKPKVQKWIIFYKLLVLDNNQMTEIY
jgi:hypothetical protein